MPKTAKKNTTTKRKTTTRKAPAKKIVASEEKIERHIVLTLTTRGKWLIGTALVLSWYMPFLISKIIKTCGL